ncbi:hypothetical protein V492_05774 [Pseudogymnoascus sp. VKM F-4246]|nr:hypothetical protein V492_05774 [Pseudogymnoascus sp. VKM F-4246]
MTPGDVEWLSLQFANLAALPAPAQRPVKATKEVTTATERLYDLEAESWEEFKSKLEKAGVAEIRPELPLLQLYFKWFATTHKGKLDDRPSIPTLIWRVGRFSYMYADRYSVDIPEGVKDGVVQYIKKDLAAELRLTSKTYEKTATGARPSAFTRSECYHNGNVALCYKRCRPFERGGVVLTLSILESKVKDLGSLVVFLFLVLRWIDRAFENVTSLHQLFHLEAFIPEGASAMRLPVTAKACTQPILLIRISATTNEESLREGWLAPEDDPIQWDPNTSSAQRNQIAGQGNSAVFTKSYLSLHLAVLVERVFKGRATCVKNEDDDDNDDDVRGIRLLRDQSAPQTLPKHLWEQIMKTDRDLQTISENRELLRQRVRRELAFLSAKGSSTKRKQNLKRQEYLKFRAEWFESRASKILASSNESQEPITATKFSPARKAVIEALYPADPSKLLMFSAAKALVFLVESSERVRGSRKRQLDPAILPAKKRRQGDSMTFIACPPAI